MADVPTFRDYNWLSLVLEADPEHYEPDTVYEFSGQREFKSTDRASSGIYDGA
jgi:hypothetical protein